MNFLLGAHFTYPGLTDLGLKKYLMPEFKKISTAIVVSLLFFLGGCRSESGRTVFDVVQVMLQQDAGLRWVFCVGLVIFFWQVFKLIGGFRRALWWIFRQFKPLFFKWRLRNLIIAAGLGTLIFSMSGLINDLLQEVEQRYFTPVWLGQFKDVNEEHLVAIYESELAKKLDSYELEVVKRRTRETAEKIHSTPLAIYECAYLECGLNPFTVRKDGVAAGWIQFTRVGLGGIKYEGQAVSFDQVLYACRQRNINLMMDLSEIYLLDKFQRAGKIPLNNTVDLYLSLFAPVHIGAPHEKVIYQGYDNPSYYLNKGLDGWYVQDNDAGKRQIFRKSKACDGAITIWEIFLALEAKKGQLVSRYLDR
jgi:hypothetical protein